MPVSNDTAGLRCPNCRSTGSEVIETRQRDGWVYRRRCCKLCEHVFPTEEHTREKTRGPIQVCTWPPTDPAPVPATTVTCE